MKVAGISTADQIKEMNDKDLLEISGMTKKRLEGVRSQIPATSSNKLESVDEDDKAKVEELAEKIVNEKEDVLLSLHLKATMMKVSDPVVFGYAVKVFYADVFEKHSEVFE